MSAPADRPEVSAAVRGLGVPAGPEARAAAGWEPARHPLYPEVVA
ncbi:hypothetical protein [Amycolatopsis jiangsuensis]|uniref:Uncharacterized protein n=1 Tax=Amycolatopsis jiangsuensis TaxID=1181879 RepID=A0A840INT8_9PSEU|nr:hypothetical protein [Amycolatopsis jiangsuensis]MBB4684101.1 hypothetical protein [Amycolatopsis jiangsuensis]